MKNADYWKKHYLNPEELNDAEKSQLLKIEPLLIELLKELKANGKIRYDYLKIENAHLVNIFLNRNEIVRNFNVLMRNLNTPEKTQNLMEKTSALGFEGDGIAHLIIEFSAFKTISDFECFKTLILFTLRDVDYKASQFNVTMSRHAPKSWAKLKPLIYNDFRNALAHGTWTLENGYVVLFKDAKLIPFERLELHAFMEKTEELTALCNCLVNIIGDMIDADFFIEQKTR